MDLPIDSKPFSGRGLALRTAGLLNGPRLLIDGAEIKGKRLRFSLRDNSGVAREIRLKWNRIDPIPKVEIEGQTIEVARALTWYEYAWMGLPIVLVVTGGGLGAFFGLMALYTSARIFRSDRGTATKCGSTALISAGAVLAFLVSVALLRGLMHPAVPR